ncbi:hypothetical protein BGX30_007732 [Mortierella sp. GBA39]|nr:hypothetical protein BGX30_007732 [Mortierella sp. GBA39]
MIYPKPPNSLDPLPPTLITTNQLFNLPRIPYFYSVTPYPLALANTLNPPSDMKRRYTSDDHNPNDPSSFPSRSYDGTNDVRIQQTQQGSQLELSEGAGADDDIDPLGVDMIEGRVLKKMKRIKLSSDERNEISSPTTSTPQQLSTQPLPMGSLRPIAPIRISTRPSSRQESAASLLASSSSSTSASSSTTLEFESRDDEKRAKAGATQPRASDSTDATLYARMNTLLHQVHASRFGIPDELPLADDGRTLPAQNGPSAPELRQHPQDPAQAFTANAAWQQHHQQQQQQQQTRIIAANTAWSQQPGGPATNTAWYQQQQRNAILAAQMMDEDDEMADVNEMQGLKIEEKLESMEIQDDDLVFDVTMKKKKKKSKKTEEEPVEEAVAESQEAAPAADAAEEDPMAMFGEKKKKKKKVKVEDEAAAEGGEEAAADAGESFDFGDMKKKKKKSKKVDFSAFEDGQDQEGDDAARDPDDIFAAEDEEGAARSSSKTGAEAEEGWIGSNRDYTYTELLSRVFKILRQNNPELAGEKKRYTIVPPSVMRDGNKKTVFANVADICKRMHRQPEHVIQFLFAELGTSGSIDGSQRLVIKGRFQQKQIEAVLRRYIVEYVTCKTCKSPDTILTKENRLFFLQCEACGSTRSVSAIKSGFQAQTGKRAAQRVKAAA